MRQLVSTALLLLSAASVQAQRPRPPLPDTTVHLALAGAPAYRSGTGPVVLFDEAHNNLHTSEGPYRAFVELLRQDGYHIQPLREVWTPAALARGRVLVVVNAVHESYFTRRAPPYLSPFTARELKALRDFLSAGGSLLFIVDQMPYPGAADAALQWFGIRAMNGYAAADSADRSGIMRFARGSGLGDHPITRGRNAQEKIDSVFTFSGSAFRAKKAGTLAALLQFGPRAVSVNPKLPNQFDEATRIEPVGGWLQGAAFAYGKGRVVVLGEAALFVAAQQPPEQPPVGLKSPAAAQNAQFGLNIFHWLSGILPLR